MSLRRRTFTRNVIDEWRRSVEADDFAARWRTYIGEGKEALNPGCIPPVVDGPDADELNRIIARINAGERES